VLFLLANMNDLWRQKMGGDVSVDAILFAFAKVRLRPGEGGLSGGKWKRVLQGLEAA
jgi:hypothetical protein